MTHLAARRDKYTQKKAYELFHRGKIHWPSFVSGFLWAVAAAGLILLILAHLVDYEQNQQLIDPVIKIESYRTEKLDTQTHIREIKVETIKPETIGVSAQDRISERPSPMATNIPQRVQAPVTKPHTAPRNEIRDYIDQVFGQHSDMAHRIVTCESQWNPNAKNKHSTASGLWQIIKSTWIENRKAMGRSTDLDLRFDYKEATDTAFFIFLHRNWQPWACKDLI